MIVTEFATSSQSSGFALDAPLAWQKIRLQQLKLSAFRNYAHLQLDFAGKHVVLSGHNGAGKTNILEAISLLSPGRGLRRASYGEMKKLNRQQAAYIEGQNSRQDLGQSPPHPHPSGTEFAVHARLISPDYDVAEIGTGSMATPSGQTARRLRINGANETAETLLDYCRVIWLVPAMDGLFTGSAGDRRRFVDRMVLATHPLHARLVTDYEKLMRSRHKLLVEGNQDTRWLNALEEQMAEVGVAIAAARVEMITHLQAMINKTDPHTNFPKASLALEGVLEQDLDKKIAAVDVEESFRLALERERALTRHSARTLTGPHRSDLKVFHADKGVAAALASTGEQKALLTGLVLVHAQLTAHLSRQTPLLLLDEIAAHLDINRRAALFDWVDEMGVQAFMTGTDRALFAHLEGKAQFLTLQDGHVVQNEHVTT